MPVQQPEKPKATVLCVDNERVIADALAMILRQCGYRSFVAYDGETGLQRARELKPDMVISDVIHDEPNGVDMAIQIREELPGVKILLVSGMATSAYLLERAGAKGRDLDLVAKPVHPQDLLAWCEHKLSKPSGDCPCSLCRARGTETPPARKSRHKPH